MDQRESPLLGLGLMGASTLRASLLYSMAQEQGPRQG